MLITEQEKRELRKFARKWQEDFPQGDVMGFAGDGLTEDFLSQMKSKWQREERESIIKEIDEIEIQNSKFKESTMEEWKLYKHIRNRLRDQLNNKE